jgi:hypothetical protein
MILKQSTHLIAHSFWIFLPVGLAASAPSPFYVRQGIIKEAMIGTKSICSLLGAKRLNASRYRH